MLWTVLHFACEPLASFPNPWPRTYIGELTDAKLHVLHRYILSNIQLFAHSHVCECARFEFPPIFPAMWYTTLCGDLADSQTESAAIHFNLPLFYSNQCLDSDSN